MLRRQSRRDLGLASYYTGVLCLQFVELLFYVLVVVLLARFALSS